MTVQTLDDRPGNALTPAVPAGVSNIVKWATDLATAAQAVELIVDTPFIPVSFWPLPQGVQIRDFPNPTLKHPRETDEEHLRRRRGAIASAASAVVYGDEIGLTAQSALTSVYVVRGRPGLYAEAMVALVKSHGHEVAVEELTDRICRMRARRRGEQEWQRFEFTIDRARRAGYDKQNPKYGTDPQSMLYPRCASITCRTVFPDVLKGLAAVEELLDEADATAPAAGNGTRTVQRAPVRAVQAPAERPAPAAPPAAATAPTGPPLPGEDDPEPQASPPIEQTDWRRLMARFNELGVNGLGQSARRLQVMSRITGRDITRGTDLTKDDAALILDNLAGDAGTRLVAQVLEPDPDSERRVGDQDSDPGIDAGDADPDSDADDSPEPAADEGRPAALEGVADPWAESGTEQTR